MLNGKGTYKWKDGKIYSGEFVNDKLDGNGIFLWPDKKKYIGQYKKDKKNGLGIFIWPNGKRYEGEWKDGKQHGYGILLNDTSKAFGLWNNGELIKFVTEEECSNLISKLNLVRFNDTQSVYSISVSSNLKSKK